MTPDQGSPKWSSLDNVPLNFTPGKLELQLVFKKRNEIEWPSLVSQLLPLLLVLPILLLGQLLSDNRKRET